MYKKIIITTIFFIAFAFNANASEIKIYPSNTSPAINQEFFVDLVLDTAGESINGIEGNISFDPKTLVFVRSENSKSFITHWIVSPSVSSSGLIKFSGIVPNGFIGFFNSGTDDTSKGNIMRLVFKPIKSGNAIISVSDSFTTLNNGEGTVSTNIVVSSLINISSDIKEESYNTFDVISPQLNAEIVSDPNLYDNKKTLVFNAVDKESGIEGVYLKKNKEWVFISNPFLLEESELQGILTIKAVDFAGNSTVKRFLIPGYSKNFLYGLILVLIILTALSIRFLYKVYAKNKI